MDEGRKGADADHQVVIFAPLSNTSYLKPRQKKTVTTRPLPESGIQEFGKEITAHEWKEVLNVKHIDLKVHNFHTTLRSKLEKHFPEKIVQISSLDKKWMNPSLKALHRQVQREFYKNRQSNKWRKLRGKFRRKKRKAVKSFYSKFVTELKQTDPGAWYRMAKRIGAIDQMNGQDIVVEELEGLNNAESAEKIAQHFAAVSNSYSPLNINKLPCYLPAERAPQVEEHDVYLKIKKLKNTKSTFCIDIPNKLRKEFAPELSSPLGDIINSCLVEGYYPLIWKKEFITPAPKVTNPKTMDELRKISSTSDYSKVFEAFLRDWIVEDIGGKIDIGQFGGQAGKGTEHMVVCLVDRILKLLDSKTGKPAVIAAMVDWKNAFDRQDPTLAILKFIQIGVRSSLIPVLLSYLQDRKMQVKFNGKLSREHSLIGGGPQGTLLGQTEYLVQSNDVADCVNDDDRFRYIDDLSILELLSLARALIEFDCHESVPSDIGTDQLFLPPENCATQGYLNNIAAWTKDNLMQINEKKSNYMIFSRTKTSFVTRLTLNDCYIKQIPEAKVVGVWLTSDMTWGKNTRELVKKAYLRIGMLTKLKYVGVGIEDLLDVYILFIRSIVEYCAVVWHSRLTLDMIMSIETVQKTCLKIVLAENYVSYTAALEMCNLKTLWQRREDRCLAFAQKCLKNPQLSGLFPLNTNNENNKHTSRESYEVNFATTETYRWSAIPYLQRKLNAQ